MSAKARRKHNARRITRINARPCTVGPLPDGSYVHLNGGYRP